MARAFEQLSRSSSTPNAISGLPVGMWDLDVILDGLQPGRLYVLAARPKMGKTTLAQNIAEYVAMRLERSMAFFIFEMKPEELGKRMLCNQAGISGNKLRSGNLDEIDWQNVTEWTRRIGEASIKISRPRIAKVQHVCAQVRRMKVQDPKLSLVVIDFHRLAHVIGHLLVDNLEAFRDLDAHAALKQVQLESGSCCEMVEMDATPVVKALLDAAEAVLGAGARKVLAAVLQEIRTIPVKVAQSLAFDSMEEEDFATFFKGVTACIGDHYAHVMLDDVRADYWRIVNGWQQPGKAA